MPTVNSSRKHYQIAFMPWAGLPNLMQIGPVVFWPYPREAEARILDHGIRRYLEKYFRSYLDNTGAPVDSIVVCSRRQEDFTPLSPGEKAKLRGVVDLLIFSVIAPQTKRAVCADNRTYGPPSADKYQLVIQNLRPDGDHIGVHAGSLLSGGWRLGEAHFTRPWAMGGSFGDPDEELVEAFDRMLKRTFPAQQRRRIVHALEWPRIAHTEEGGNTEEAKMVMMATAFEIALNPPRGGSKKASMANTVDMELALSRSRRSTGTVDKGKGKKKQYSSIAWWMWDSYTVRNAIVHGDRIAPSKLQYRGWLHRIVADLVLWQWVVKKLFDHRCLGADVRRHVRKVNGMLGVTPLDTGLQASAESLLGFEDMHEALGWLRPYPRSTIPPGQRFSL